MRTVVRNSFARHTIKAERVRVTPFVNGNCTECGQTRGPTGNPWLYRFRVDDDSGPRHSAPIADGKLFCSRACAETFTGQRFDETQQGA